MSEKNTKKLRKILADSNLPHEQRNKIKLIYKKLPHDEKNNFLKSLDSAKRMGQAKASELKNQ